jgi:chromosome segregation ATPase
VSRNDLWLWLKDETGLALAYVPACDLVGLQAKVEELERENAALRHSEENLAATVRGLEFELEKAQKTAALLRGTVEALGDANDRLTIEITALRKQAKP